VRAFLEQAAAATGTGIPGVVPTVWPYPRNEQVVSMYTLLIAQLLDQPALHDAIHPQVADMWRGVRTEGQGISDWFTPDGDITAMTLAVVASKGYQADRAMLQRYRNGNSYLTYRHELQRSFSATAHAAHTLALLGGDPDPLFDQLCEHRAPDGRWMGDKWHASWLYLTAHTIIALLAAGRGHKALETLPALLDHQHRDGSWGVTTAVEEETAYGVLALIAFDRAGLLPEHGQQALHRAGAWLAQHYRPLTEATGSCWIGKELYRPRRISRTVEVSATLSCVLTGYAA